LRHWLNYAAPTGAALNPVQCGTETEYKHAPIATQIEHVRLCLTERLLSLMWPRMVLFASFRAYDPAMPKTWSSFHRWVMAGVYPNHCACSHRGFVMDFSDIENSVGEPE
jgi:hypothetical protein